MKWKTAVSCTIFGSTYGAGAKLNTDSWTNEQLNYQLYLGHIVPDTDVGPPTVINGNGGDWSGNFDNHPFSGGARGAFTAPPTGRIQITQMSTSRSAGANGYVRVSAQVNSGASVTGGTRVGGTHSAYFHDSKIDYNSSTAVVTGLTPGERYNAFQLVTNTTGGAVMSQPRIIILPLPW